MMNFSQTVVQHCQTNKETVYKIEKSLQCTYVATGGWLWVASKSRRKVAEYKKEIKQAHWAQYHFDCTRHLKVLDNCE